MLKKKGIKLRFAISLLVILTAFSTTIVNWYSSSIALKRNLTETYLENNNKYAHKIASSADSLFFSMQQNVNALAEMIGRKGITQEELERWQKIYELAENPRDFSHEMDWLRSRRVFWHVN